MHLRKAPRWTRIAGVVALLTLNGIACGSPSSSRDSGVPGYEHGLARSTFQIGEFVGVRDTALLEAVDGTLGSFAVQRTSRSATAIPNFGLPVPDNIFPGDDAAQNKAVHEYFVGAGIPADQVLSLSANQTLITWSRWPEEGELPDPNAEPSWGTILAIAWYSVLHRGFEGVEIVDSTAWAMLGSNGNALTEQVYWPSLDAGVVEELDAFRAVLDDASERERYFARLPSIAEGRLVIRHTSWFYDGPFVARAAYRATFSGGAHLDFDIRGQLLTLPDEVAPEVSESCRDCAQ